MDSLPVRCFAACAVLALGAASCVAWPALGQSGERGTMVSDDGQTRRVMHYAEPDFDYAIRPDYDRGDLPIFVDVLELNADQRELVAFLIDQYLVELRAIIEKHKPEVLANAEKNGPGGRDALAGGGPAREAGGEGEGGEGGMPPLTPDEAQRQAIRGIVMDELRKEGFDAPDWESLPFGPPSIRIGVSIGDDGSGPQPNVDVGVSFGNDDDSLSEDVRQRLQAAADRMVPRLTEQVKQRLLEDMKNRDQEGGHDADAEFSRRWDELERDRDLLESILAEKRALRDRFERQVMELLTVTQLERWPVFLRTITRVKSVPLGTLDGERTDLLALLDEVSPRGSRESSVAAVASEYEERLHEALTRRNDLLDGFDARLDRALYKGDHRQAKSLAERLSRARLDIRDLNDQYLERLAATLDPDAAASLSAKAAEVSYPRVHRRTIGREAFDSAAALGDLTDDQRSLIADLARTYADELDRINQSLVQRIRQSQAEELTSQVVNVIALLEGADADPEDAAEARAGLARAFQDRQNIDARYVTSLRALLTPDQAAHLPQAPTTDVATPVHAEHGEAFEIEDDGGGL